MRLIDPKRLLREIEIDKYGHIQTTINGLRIAMGRSEVEAEPVKHGRWIVVSDGYGNGDATAHICECSECKDTIWVYKKATRRWNYCPNCGAQMDLKEEAETEDEP